MLAQVRHELPGLVLRYDNHLIKARPRSLLRGVILLADSVHQRARGDVLLLVVAADVADDPCLLWVAQGQRSCSCRNGRFLHDRQFALRHLDGLLNGHLGIDDCFDERTRGLIPSGSVSPQLIQLQEITFEVRRRLLSGFA